MTREGWGSIFLHICLTIPTRHPILLLETTTSSPKEFLNSHEPNKAVVNACPEPFFWHTLEAAHTHWFSSKVLRHSWQKFISSLVHTGCSRHRSFKEREKRTFHDIFLYLIDENAKECRLRFLKKPCNCGPILVLCHNVKSRAEQTRHNFVHEAKKNRSIYDGFVKLRDLEYS